MVKAVDHENINGFVLIHVIQRKKNVQDEWGRRGLFSGDFTGFVPRSYDYYFSWNILYQCYLFLHAWHVCLLERGMPYLQILLGNRYKASYRCWCFLWNINNNSKKNGHFEKLMIMGDKKRSLLCVFVKKNGKNTKPKKIYIFWHDN